MPADEVTHGTDVEASRVRTGPRHAAPKKPLFTRFHVPAGKAIALAAMPTAVLMGMGFTPTLALADDQPASKSLTADEYKDCLAALEDGASPSASPSPSTSASGDDAKDPSDGSSDSSDKGDSAEPNPSPSSDGTGSSGDSSSSDSGSGDKADPTPSPSASSSGESDSASEASPSPSESGGNLLEGIGDAITGIFTGGTKATDSASPTPSATPSASASPDSSGDGSDSAASTDKGTSDSLKDATKKVTDTVGDTVKDTTDGASKTVEDTTKGVEKAAEDAADGVTASPSPSESSGTDAEDCPVATDDEGGVDNAVPLPDKPWRLEASSLLLKGADYQGVVDVRTANGKTKKVLKYVISEGTDIGDLHQIVSENGKTYHVQAGKGTTSTIRDGKTIMYTESISGNLFGLIPITFDPENPPPLNIPLIYFTNAKVTQAAQFGGTLHVPGMRQFSE
ncbi:Hydrogenase expression protein HypF OS=Streptomyces alboniger OX=132473 GN=CP975_24805 PE=4 SV=1 [Streptomyces alboniger]